MMKLKDAFGISRGDVVSFIGAGGKTTALINLAYELADTGLRVVVVSTNTVDLEYHRMMPHALRRDAGSGAISSALYTYPFVFVHEPLRFHTLGKDATIPATPLSAFSEMLDTLDSDVILVDADQARGLPLKAPLPKEPLIPAESTHVIVMASLDALGKPLNAEHVYNPEAITQRYGFTLDAPIKSPWVAQVLRDEELGLKGVPNRAKVFGLLNQTPGQGYLRARSRLIARLMLRSPRFSGVALGMARAADPVHEVQRSVGAVVLAAGLSRRMGEPKVLLPWSGRKTIIEQIIEQLILAQVNPITVVTGYEADKVRLLAEKWGVNVVHNRRYETGEMLSSVKVGLKAMPAHVMGALVVLGDQPRIQARIVNQVMMAYAEGQGRIIAPSYQMQRGHPLLIDRYYWPEILRLKAKENLRQVINIHADEIAYVTVDTDSVLRDVDTPDDYAGERFRAGLDGPSPLT